MCRQTTGAAQLGKLGEQYMRQSIMQTWNELKAAKSPVNGLPIYFEYVSKYRRVLVLNDGNTWVLRVSYKADAKNIPSWEKTYGDKSVCFAWANVQVENRNIVVSPAFTIIEAKGKTLINRL